MKKDYYIVQIYKIGNIGGCDINKIKDQPKGGFKTKRQAETHLEELLNSDKHPFNWRAYSYSIMPMYSILK